MLAEEINTEKVISNEYEETEVKLDISKMIFDTLVEETVNLLNKF